MVLENTTVGVREGEKWQWYAADVKWSKVLPPPSHLPSFAALGALGKVI